jgi:hypothetical protein
VQGAFEQQIVLTCEDCGGKLVLFGPEEDWRSRHAVLRADQGAGSPSTAAPMKRSSSPLSCSSTLACPSSLRQGFSSFAATPMAIG